MGGKSLGKSFVSLILILALCAQNLLYAGGPGRERRLEDPLLAADYLVAPQRGHPEERPAEEKPDLELATLSSAASEEALEVESRPESHLAPLSAEAENFLDLYGLTADHLRDRDISFADFQRLFDMDTSLLWNWARVVAINRVVPHTLEAPFRGGSPRWPEGGMAPIKLPSKRTIPAFLDAFTAFTYENLERVFKLTILGFLVVDFQEANSFSSAISLLWGNEEHTVNHLLSFFQTAPGPYILGAGLALPFVWGSVHGALTARHVRHDGTQEAPYRSLSMAEPLLEGAPHSRFKDLADHLTAHSQTAWSHYGLPFLMWFVPFKEDPIAEHLSEMVASLRWNGSLTAEEGRDIFRAVQAVSEQRGISGLMATDQLLEIMHGVNFKDFRYLLNKPGELTEDEKERLLMVLEIKTQALTHLKALADLRAQWAGRQSVPEGLERVLKGLYCKSLLWYGGQSGGWDDPAAWLTRGFMLGLKGVKTWLLVNLLTALVNALVEFAQCPNAFKELEQGDIGPISNTLACFNEYVRIFNQIPGQPVETLISLIPNVAFQGNQYELDLSNHGIGNATTLAQILNAFQQNGIGLTALDLSGNLGRIASPPEYEELGQAIEQHQLLQTLGLSNNILGVLGRINFLLRGNLPNLQSLDLSLNGFGSNQTDTMLLGELLPDFPTLTFLNVSRNVIGLTGNAGTVALSQGLRSLPQLISLDLHANFIGFTADNGTIALGEALPFLPQLTFLDLGDNPIGFTGDAGTVSLGKGLASLQHLTYLNLNETIIGYTGTNGTIAIAEALQSLPNLTYLDLSGGGIGTTGDAGIQALAAGFSGTPNLQTFFFLPQEATLSAGELNLLNMGLQQTKAGPLPFVFLTEDGMENYVLNLPQNTTTINLSGHLNNPSASMIQALFQGIQERALKITKLILSNTDLGSIDATPLTALGEGFKELPGLTYLDLSNNGFGLLEDGGTTALGNGLQVLSNLTYLDLSQNNIGFTRDAGTAALGNGLQALSYLTYLNLSNNAIGYIGDAGTAALGNGLQYLPGLTYLDLSNNGYIGSIGDAGTAALGNGLQALSNLTYLDLSANDIGATGDTGTTAIGNGLQTLSNLTYLDLGYNNIGYIGVSGTGAVGNGLQFLSNLTYLDLSANAIGFTGDTGTMSLGEGLRNHTALTTLNLADNNLGQYGPEGLEILLNNTVREGLNLNLAGAVGIPWSTGSQALATLNAGPVAAACYQQRCFGGTAPQNMTSIQSVGTRRVLAVEEVLVGEENETSTESSRPGFLARWGQSVRRFVTHAATSTKQTLTTYWDAFGNWLTNTLTDAAHEVVTNSPSYFPNGNNRHVRDWPVGGGYLLQHHLCGPLCPSSPCRTLCSAPITLTFCHFLPKGNEI